MKKNRTNLISKFRNLGDGSTSSSVENIMAEEYRHLQDEVDGLPQLVFMDEDGFRVIMKENVAKYLMITNYKILCILPYNKIKVA